MSERELDILNILFKKSEPMIAIDIVNERKDLTQSTVTMVLRKLLKAGLVQVDGVTHSGKVLSRTYVPTEKAKEVVLKDFFDRYNMIQSIVSVDEATDYIKNMKRRETA